MYNNSFVYILGNSRPTLYVGVTIDLEKRIIEHKLGKFDSFTKKYVIKKLLYFETYPSTENALAREKQLKGWHCEWKLNLIRTINPEFSDLSASIVDLEVLDPETSSG